MSPVSGCSLQTAQGLTKHTLSETYVYNDLVKPQRKCLHTAALNETEAKLQKVDIGSLETRKKNDCSNHATAHVYHVILFMGIDK